jgi:Flp pilus assembly protein TadD
MGLLDRLSGKKGRTKEEYFRMGCRAAKRGNLSDAIGAWRAVARMDPADGTAHYCLGLAYFLKDPVGLRREAVREWQNARALVPAKLDYRTTVALASTNDTEGLTEWVQEQWKQLLERG